MQSHHRQRIRFQDLLWLAWIAAIMLAAFAVHYKLTTPVRHPMKQTSKLDRLAAAACAGSELKEQPKGTGINYA